MLPLREILFLLAELLFRIEDVSRRPREEEFPQSRKAAKKTLPLRLCVFAGNSFFPCGTLIPHLGRKLQCVHFSDPYRALDQIVVLEGSSAADRERKSSRKVAKPRSREAAK